MLRFVELEPVSSTLCSGTVTSSLTTSTMASSWLYIMWGSYYDQLFLQGLVPILTLTFCYVK